MTSNNKAYSVHIYLPDGSPDGSWSVTKDNWDGTLFVCPRSLLAERKNQKEFNRPGVYILLGPNDEAVQTIYIGEGDPVLDRILEHNAKKDFWVKVVCCTKITDQGLNKADIQYLESKLIELATELKIVDLDNGNNPGLPTISDADKSRLDSFLSVMLELAPIVGIGAFEKPVENTTDTKLFIHTKGVHAEGYDTPQGFLVKKGSSAVSADTPSLLISSKELKKHLREQGVLLPVEDRLVFQQDYVFRASSPAAEIILGRSENGRRVWKDETGKTLADLQEVIK